MRHNPNPQIIYEFIATYWQQNGYAPSISEIADHVDLSYQVTHGYLVQLRAVGTIDWKPHKLRTIRICGDFISW